MPPATGHEAQAPSTQAAVAHVVLGAGQSEGAAHATPASPGPVEPPVPPPVLVDAPAAPPPPTSLPLVPPMPPPTAEAPVEAPPLPMDVLPVAWCAAPPAPAPIGSSDAAPQPTAITVIVAKRKFFIA